HADNGAVAEGTERVEGANGAEAAATVDEAADALTRTRLLRALIPLALLVSVVMIFLALELRRRNKAQHEQVEPTWHPRPHSDRRTTPNRVEFEPSVNQPLLASGELEVVASDSATLLPHVFHEPEVMECPECRREFDALLTRCPFDGTDLVAVQTKPGTPVVDTLDTSTTHMGCPTCQKAFE